VSSAAPAAAERVGRRRLVPIPMQGLVGLVLFGLGLWALIADLEAWNTVWYLPAWYGYLLVLDAVISLRGRRSFVADRPGELVSMMLWSLPFWLLFEAFNLRLRNWYYVFGLRTLWGSLLMSTLAFATVLPACFFHADALEAFGAFRDKRWRPLRVTRVLLGICAAAGAAAVVLPLLAPRQFFWMVWGGPVAILEVANYRSGAPSLLRDLENGRPGRFLRLLAGGLLAGAVWELLNYWARTKWIYTVPGFEQAKLMEMPFAGFGGFPPLALSAFAVHSFVSRLRGRSRLATVAFAIVFSAAASAMILDRNVQSVRPLLSELTGLNASEVARLRAAGIPTPERLDRAARREGLMAIAARSGVSADVLERAEAEAALALHKGMGIPAARLLEATGIRSVADLASADTNELTARLSRAAADRGEAPPRPEYVRVWVRAARADGRPRR
jgi:Domain of unknown function (DUF4332)